MTRRGHPVELERADVHDLVALLDRIVADYRDGRLDPRPGMSGPAILDSYEERVLDRVRRALA